MTEEEKAEFDAATESRWAVIAEADSLMKWNAGYHEMTVDEQAEFDTILL